MHGRGCFYLQTKRLGTLIMDSLRFHQATASNIGGFNDKNNAGNMVDLNLKLGLANHYELNHQIKLSDLFNIPVVPVTTPSLANFNFNGPNTSDEVYIYLSLVKFLIKIYWEKNHILP